MVAPQSRSGSVNRRHDHSRRRLGLSGLTVFGLAVLGLALSGCGRKGPLDPPPGAAAEPVQQGDAGQTPANQPRGPNKRIILDGLLN
jgi:predicted small lipoprotein YifL